MAETVLILAALAALVFGLVHAGHDTGSWQAAAVKTASVALLALAGWMLGAPGWIVAGLALGALGDLALARPGTAAFLAGMAAFALGHLAYAVEFWARAGSVGPLAWALIAGTVAMVVWCVLWLAPKAGGLVWPVRAYALVIGAMVALAALMPPGLALAGALAFMASDLILAVRMFVLVDPARRLRAARVLWPVYWGSQALILAGTLA